MKDKLSSLFPSSITASFILLAPALHAAAIAAGQTLAATISYTPTPGTPVKNFAHLKVTPIL